MKTENYDFRQLNRLISEISHEVKNPLGTGITAASYLKKTSNALKENLEEGRITRGDLENFIHSISESSDILQKNLQQAAELVEAFKRLTAAQATCEKKEFNVRTLLNDIFLTLSPRLKRKSITVKIAGDDKIIINSQPGAFFQIINNLVINSINHGFEEKRDCRLTIEFYLEEDSFVIQYGDNGKGIAPEIQDKIFDEYFTTAEDKGGTGIGMYLVREIVEKRLNGTIALESVPEKGTTFTISLPVK